MTLRRLVLWCVCIVRGHVWSEWEYAALTDWATLKQLRKRTCDRCERTEIEQVDINRGAKIVTVTQELTRHDA